MLSSSHRGGIVIAIIAALAAASPGSAQGIGTPGTTVESVLALGRRLSPELRAVALDTEAAAARADAAGRLDDPTFRAMSDEVDRTGGPRINKTYLSVEQEFPLWGKLELRHSAALAAVDAAPGRARAANPRLFSGAAEVRSAESERRLAEKAWYPNVTLGAGAIQRDNGPAGYTASLALKIPLQWGAKEAGVREAVAKHGAAQQRLAQIEAEIAGHLGQSLGARVAGKRVGQLTRKRLIPQLETD